MNIKKIVSRVLVCVGILILMVVCMRISYSRGRSISLAKTRSSLSLNIAALGALQHGNSAKAIEWLEGATYRHAIAVIKDVDPDELKPVLDSIVEYRLAWGKKESARNALEEEIDTLLTNWPKPTSLVVAIIEGQSIDKIEEIVRADPSIISRSETNVVGGSPLIMAAYAQQTNVVSFLVQNGADAQKAISILGSVSESNAMELIRTCIRNQTSETGGSRVMHTVVPDRDTGHQ